MKSANTRRLLSTGKLSDRLAAILVDPGLRHTRRGICKHHVVVALGEGRNLCSHIGISCRAACTQTGSIAYPVKHPTAARGEAYSDAARAAGMWRGEYGQNRRKFLRDCIHWLRERGY